MSGGEQESVESSTGSVPTGADVSVVVCVYNRPQDLETCLNSLFEQHCTTFELVVVNDASTDATPMVIDRFIVDHPTRAIVKVTAKTNGGVSAARNLGIDASTRPIVAFTDSDCTVDPNWVDAIAAPFVDAGVVSVGGRVVDDPATTFAEEFARGTNRIGLGFRQQRPLVGCNMAFRRQLIAELKFDPGYSYYCDEDDVVRRIRLRGGTFAHATEAVVEHHHPITWRSIWTRAWRQGRGSARLWRATKQIIGRDIVFLMGTMLMLPLMLWDVRLWAIPTVLFGLQLVASLFNHRVYRGRTWGRAFVMLPIDFVYNVIKLVSVLTNHIAWLIGRA